MQSINLPRVCVEERGGSAGFQSQAYLRKETLERHAAMEAQRAGSATGNRAVKRVARSRESEGGAAAALRGAGGLDAREIAAKALANEDIARKIREQVIQRGGSNGIQSLQRLLMIMDDNGDKRLTKDELKYGLRDYGLDLSPAEIDQAFAYFDRDRNGFVDITEFLVGIRGELNERRKKMIRLAFDILDKDGSGFVTVEEIADVYDVSANPDVQCGKKTIEEALKDFLGQWERGDKDGIVTYEEFEDYYKEISASIDGDDYFELMIRNAWRIAGGEGQAANTANLRVLVTDKDGKQKVATVEQELGLKQGDKEEIIKRLTKQGVDASNVELYGGIDATEKPNKAVRRAHGGDRAPPPSPSPSSPLCPSCPHLRRRLHLRHCHHVQLSWLLRGRQRRRPYQTQERKRMKQGYSKSSTSSFERHYMTHHAIWRSLGPLCKCQW